jgi:hypothetical protein
MPNLILPDAPEKYDARNERETRRLIMAATQPLPLWSNIAQVPSPVTAFAALTGAADSLPYFTGLTTMALATLTPFSRTLLALATVALWRATLDVYSKAETDALSPARAATVITTASLAVLASENSSVSVPFYSGTLLKITADRACWVRLYGTATDRSNDNARVLGITAAAGVGLQAEFVFSASVLSVNVSPIADLANEDTVRAKTLYYSIENLSAGASTVAVTITVVPVEK